MADTDRADNERRLRIRRRNLERLEQEAREVEEAEAPPAVLGRLQAQIRVEREEIRMLEGQVAEAGNRHSRPGSGKAPSAADTGEGMPRFGSPSIIVRVVLGLVATGVLLVIVLIVAPRPQSTGVAIPPTLTISPTFTPGAGLGGQGMAAISNTQSTSGTGTITVVQPAETPAPAPTEPPTPTAPPATPTPAAMTGSVTADPLNVRSGPATSFDALAQLSVGDVITVTGRNQASDWLAITTPSGQTGWVAAQYVTTGADVRGLPVKQQ